MGKKLHAQPRSYWDHFPQKEFDLDLSIGGLTILEIVYIYDTLSITLFNFELCFWIR